MGKMETEKETRNREIFKRYMLNKRNGSNDFQDRIADSYDITKQRVSQICITVKKKLCREYANELNEAMIADKYGITMDQLNKIVEEVCNSR